MNEPDAILTSETTATPVAEPEPLDALPLAPPAPMEPVTVTERIETLDVLRGFAIFGILVVNIWMSYTGMVPVLNLDIWRSETADKVTVFLITFLMQGKFYSLFSFLFGLGLAVQMGRAAERGTGIVRLYIRRLFVLLGIGLVHAFLIWMGDILVTYAVLGFLLILFRNAKPRTLLIAGGCSLALGVILFAGLVTVLELLKLFPQFAAEMESAAASQPEASLAASLRIYSEGSFGEIMLHRAGEVIMVYVATIFFAPDIFAMFLLGLFAGRQGYFRNIPAHAPFIRKVFWWGLPVGVVGNLGYVLAGGFGTPGVMPSWITLIGIVLYTIGAPALCCCYIAGLTLLFNRPAGRALGILASVGRMALTNYLSQSVICTLIFYSYGLGLIGKVNPTLGVGLAVAIYLVQIVWSHWWLRHFKFGPMEWVWRSLTYGQAQPMRSS